jgi:hypothetical protein
MKQQQLEAQLAAIKLICADQLSNYRYGANPFTLAKAILATYDAPQGPCGGMVDTQHSKCCDASRVGSSPTTGTTPKEKPALYGCKTSQLIPVPKGIHPINLVYALDAYFLSKLPKPTCLQ